MSQKAFKMTESSTQIVELARLNILEYVNVCRYNNSGGVFKHKWRECEEEMLWDI